MKGRVSLTTQSSTLDRRELVKSSFELIASYCLLHRKLNDLTFFVCGFALQQWTNLCNTITCQDWKKPDCKNGVTISRLSFNKNEKASVKVTKWLIIFSINYCSQDFKLQIVHLKELCEILMTSLSISVLLLTVILRFCF